MSTTRRAKRNIDKQDSHDRGDLEATTDTTSGSSRHVAKRAKANVNATVTVTASEQGAGIMHVDLPVNSADALLHTESKVATAFPASMTSMDSETTKVPHRFSVKVRSQDLNSSSRFLLCAFGSHALFDRCRVETLCQSITCVVDARMPLDHRVLLYFWQHERSSARLMVSWAMTRSILRCSIRTLLRKLPSQPPLKQSTSVIHDRCLCLHMELVLGNLILP